MPDDLRDKLSLLDSYLTARIFLAMGGGARRGYLFQGPAAARPRRGGSRGSVRRYLALLSALAVAAVLTACAGEPGSVASGKAPPEAFVVEVTAVGPPLLNGEPRMVGEISQRLRETDPTPTLTLRLPPEVPLDRLWEVRERLAAGQQQLLRETIFELPVAAGEGAGGHRAFQPAPPFVVLGREEVRVGRDGERPLPLGSMEELLPFAAGVVALDPDALFVLTREEGVGPEALSTALPWLERGRAQRFLVYGEGGLRPLDRPTPEAAGEGDRPPNG